MPSSLGFHRMSPSCTRGATASDGVTFIRAFSSLIPSTCFIACLLFAWTNFHQKSLRESQSLWAVGGLRLSMSASSLQMKSRLVFVFRLVRRFRYRFEPAPSAARRNFLLLLRCATSLRSSSIAILRICFALSTATAS